MPRPDTIPLVSAPEMTVDSVSLSKTYAASVRRTFRTATERCISTRKVFGLSEVFLQMAVRAAVIEKPTSIKELSAMRDLIGKIYMLKNSYDQAGYIKMPFQLAPKNIELPPWFRFEDWDSFDLFAEHVMRTTRSELQAYGCRKLGALVEEAEGRNPRPIDRKREHVAAGYVAGRVMAGARRSPKLGWVPISESEFDLICDQLPSGGESAGLESLRDGKRPKMGGVARILARSAWLTGMRALEVFRCRLLTTDPNMTCSDMERKRILDDPRAAYERGCLHDADFEILRNGLKKPGRRPLLLAIRTLKTANSSPRIYNSIRFQALNGIEQRDLATLTRASLLGRLKLPRTRAESIAGRCTAHLKIASLRVDSRRRNPVTLHTLRHAFIDTARRELPPHEVAALSGHTSRGTMLGYGGKHVRRRRSSGSTRWMPKADPANARAIKAAWSIRMARKAKPEPEPELVPEPRFH